MKDQKSKIKNSLKAKSYKLKADDGITLYLAMLVMGGALAVALSVSTVFIGEFKISSETVNSLKAVYVADSAMEYTLYQMRPEANYDSNVQTLTTTNYGIISLSDPSPLNILSVADCHATVAPGMASVSCDAKAQLVAKDSVFGCSNTTAADCTRIVTSGSFSGVNRALEIVYPNL